MIYGKDFAFIYSEKWAFWGPKMWDFLSPIIREQVPNAITWLDLCCGTGSLLHLASDAGFDTTGVDISKYQIEHARHRIPNARLIVDDIRQLSLNCDFDVITCMFDSLNYLTTKHDLLKAFRKAKHHLAQGGIFVFDMNTFEGLQDQWCKTSTIYERDLTLIVETSFDAKRALGCCLITGFVRDGKLYRRFQEEHLERGYRAEEIEDLLYAVGFQFKKFDGYSLGRPRKRSGRLLYLCMNKPAIKASRLQSKSRT